MTPPLSSHPVVAIAHRGDPVGHRENTLPAFAAAVAQGADMLELDLRRTRDGAIVVLHDQSLLRLWGLDASVGDLDLSEVERLGEGDVRIPTLRAVLDAHAASVDLMVDFTRREVVAGALHQAMAADVLDRCLFVTGNVEALRLLRGLSGQARIGLTWTRGRRPAVGPARGARGGVLESDVQDGDGGRCRRRARRRPRRLDLDGGRRPTTWPGSWRPGSTPS